MRAISILSVVILLAVAVAFQLVPEASASNGIAKREALTCTSCHDKPGSKLLTDRGKYYELMSSLEGYDELQASFSRCTACHVRKPGSDKLTKKGKQFRLMLDDMEGLKALLLDHHPSQEPDESSIGGAPATPAPTADSPDGAGRRE